MDEDRYQLTDPALRHHGDRPVWPWIVAAIVILALGIGAWVWLRGRGQEAETAAAAPPAEAPAPEPAPPAAEPARRTIELPPLDASDELVRSLVAEVTAHPAIARALATDGLVRRFVAAVEAFAVGRNPRTALGLAPPGEPFRVASRSGRLLIDPRSYRRQQTWVEAFTAIDVAGAARLLADLDPLLEQAYREIGRPGATFDQALDAALRRVIEAPAPPDDAELVAGSVAYEWSDPRLEALAEADKLLLRLGAENLARVQAKARELRAAIAP